MIVHNSLINDLEGLFTRLNSTTAVCNSASSKSSFSKSSSSKSSSSTSSSSSSHSTSTSVRYSSPPIDTYKRGSDVWIDVDLPGVSNDSLDIDVEGSVLTITAKRESVRQEGDQNFRRERRRGTFRRVIDLGDDLDPERIEANFSDGVLTLRIAVAEQAKARKVDVNFGRPVETPTDTVEADPAESTATPKSEDTADTEPDETNPE